MARAIPWLGEKLWRWEVLAVGVPALYGAGISAMYADEYTAAIVLYVAALAWCTAKILTWKEAREHEAKRGISILVVAIAACLLCASLYWALHRYEHVSRSNTAAVISAVAIQARAFLHFFSQPWPQRIVAIVLGIAFVLLAQRMVRAFRIRASKGKHTHGTPKGYFDYKLQVEESVQRLHPELIAIAAIIEQTTPMIAAQAKRIQPVDSPRSSTQSNVKTARGIAKVLLRCSKQLDFRCSNLEKVGDAFAEGLSGWLTYVKNNHVNDLAAKDMVRSLKSLVGAIDSCIRATDTMLANTESVQGISRDLNSASTKFLRSFQRLKGVAEKIRESCSTSLSLFEKSQQDIKT